MINLSIMSCHFSPIKLWEAAPEEKSLEATAEDSQFYGADMT